jgi:hypothetical protein
MLSVKLQGFMLVGLVATTLVGCGPKPAKLDKNVATTSLNTFLEGWKSGETPQALKAKTPSIIAKDADFDAGRKLVEYKVIDADKSDGSNLTALVELTVGEAGNTKKRQVSYIISTSPVITVFQLQ